MTVLNKMPLKQTTTRIVSFPSINSSFSWPRDFLLPLILLTTTSTVLHIVSSFLPIRLKKALKLYSNTEQAARVSSILEILEKCREGKIIYAEALSVLITEWGFTEKEAKDQLKYCKSGSYEAI